MTIHTYIHSGVEYLIPKEKREEEDPDVRTVDVSVRHDHDTMVSEASRVEIVALPSTQVYNSTAYTYNCHCTVFKYSGAD